MAQPGVLPGLPELSCPVPSVDCTGLPILDVSGSQDRAGGSRLPVIDGLSPPALDDVVRRRVRRVKKPKLQERQHMRIEALADIPSLGDDSAKTWSRFQPSGLTYDLLILC